MSMKISTVQQRIIDLLSADPFFVDRTDPNNPIVKVPIVFKKQGDIDSKIDEAIAEIGMAMIVVFRYARRVDPAGPSKDLALQFGLTAVTNPTANADTDPEALDIAEKAYDIVDGQSNVANPSGDQIDLFHADGTAIRPMPVPKKPMLDIQLLLIDTIITKP